jgi:hypothetical protein
VVAHDASTERVAEKGRSGLGLGADLKGYGRRMTPRRRPNGPHDDRRGCTTQPAGQEPAIACSLNAEAMPARLDDWERVLGFVTARSPLTDGLRLDLDASVPIAEVVGLVAAEHDCRFFAFAVTIDDRGFGLEVCAPPDALPIVLTLFGAPSATTEFGN